MEKLDDRLVDLPTPPKDTSFLGKIRTQYELGEFKDIQKAGREDLEKLQKKYEAARKQIQSEIFDNLLEEVQKRKDAMPSGQGETKKMVKKISKKKKIEVTDYSYLQGKSDPVRVLRGEGIRAEKVKFDEQYLIKYSGEIGGKKYSGGFQIPTDVKSTYKKMEVQGDKKFFLEIGEDGGRQIVVKNNDAYLTEKAIDDYLVEKNGYKKENNIYIKTLPSGLMNIYIRDKKVYIYPTRTPLEEEVKRDVREVARILAQNNINTLGNQKR